MEAEEADCARQAEEAAAVEKECKAQLETALPALLAAEEALKKLSKADITELNSMKAPPAGVVKVMEALCKLFGIPPQQKAGGGSNNSGAGGSRGATKEGDFWVPAKRQLLGDSRFLQRLLNFDRDAVKAEAMAAITPYERDPDFDPEVIRKASVAATSLCLWVRAVIAYNRAATEVRPRRAALQEAQTRLQAAQELLDGKVAQLRQVEGLIDQLSSQHQGALERAEALRREVEMCSRRLHVAEKLITSLAGERGRWCDSLKALEVGRRRQIKLSGSSSIVRPCCETRVAGELSLRRCLSPSCSSGSIGKDHWRRSFKRGFHCIRSSLLSPLQDAVPQRMVGGSATTRSSRVARVRSAKSSEHPRGNAAVADARPS